jgi:hypothetical protein
LDVCTSLASFFFLSFFFGFPCADIRLSVRRQTYTALLAALPSLKKAVNGVLPASYTTGSIILVLDGNHGKEGGRGKKGKGAARTAGMWDGDGWTGQHRLNVSMCVLDLALL